MLQQEVRLLQLWRYVCLTTFSSLLNKTIYDKHCLKNLTIQLTLLITGLEEDDEINEEILTFVTTNHQGQQFITNQHHKSNGVVNQPTPPNFGDEEQSRKRYVNDSWKSCKPSFSLRFCTPHYKLCAITIFLYFIFILFECTAIYLRLWAELCAF